MTPAELLAEIERLVAVQEIVHERLAAAREAAYRRWYAATFPDGGHVQGDGTAPEAVAWSDISAPLQAARDDARQVLVHLQRAEQACEEVAKL